MQNFKMHMFILLLITFFFSSPHSHCCHCFGFLKYLSNMTKKVILTVPLSTNQPYNSYNVSSKNLILDHLIIPKLIFFFILITYLVDIELLL